MTTSENAFPCGHKSYYTPDKFENTRRRACQTCEVEVYPFTGSDKSLIERAWEDYLKTQGPLATPQIVFNHGFRAGIAYQKSLEPEPFCVGGHCTDYEDHLFSKCQLDRNPRFKD